MVLILYYTSILAVWLLSGYGVVKLYAHVGGIFKCTAHRVLGSSMLSIASVLIAIHCTSVIAEIRNISASLP